MMTKTKLGLVALSLSLLSANAMAVQCAAAIKSSYGQTLRTFYGQGYDEKNACMEARKACRLELNEGQRRGQYYGADCELVGVIGGSPSNPYPPTNPNPYPPTNPNPYPPTNPYPGQGSYQRELQEIESLLKSYAWQTRQMAARELSRYPVARALELAITTLKDSDSDVRNEAQKSINSLMGSIDFYYEANQVYQVGARLVKDSSWMVRLGAVKALDKVSTLAVVELIKASNDSDSDVRAAAERALLSLRQSYDVQRIDLYTLDQVESLYSSSSWKVRLQVVHVLGSSRAQKYRSTLIRAMGDSDSDVRNAARLYY